ncbi:unnamed protein product [Microthlaspi erraticum]|uniref:Uncharacterized protein n=1 Tax=Microthlaspi erraticum TaxID=1685480 RepID=A0A6D2HUV7_9BRAS|nr:unnamed protein product [Microthlaspi erraticum]
MLEDEETDEVLVKPTVQYYERYLCPEPMQPGGGFGWLNIQHHIERDDESCLHAVRMRREAFRMLCQSLENDYGLAATENISIEESVAMFLTTCGHNEVQRTVARNFGRNQETVNRKFHEVLTAMERLACDQMKTPTVQQRKEFPRKLRANKNYWPYFQGFIGAIDGTHVPVIAPEENRRAFWDRFGEASLNIMAICDIDLLFTYIWNGAPGSVHDSRVLAIAQQTSRTFPKPPPGKYYLVDSGYANKKGYLAPYRGNRRESVRYHL